MPIYEYRVVGGHCDICRGCFELRRPADASPLTCCPICKKPVEKLLSTVNSPRLTKPFSYVDAKKAGFTLLKRRDKGVYEKL